MISASVGGRTVPVAARELAAGLCALFERDVEIARRLADAARRLHEANERLCSGDGAAVLGALAQVRWTMHRAFHDYQSAAEDRRALAADAGEVVGRFVGVLVAAGWSEQQARTADVYELAGVVR